MRSLLDHQADGIEYTLHSHGLDANVVGGNISPRLIQFHIQLGNGVKYNRVVALADELALALGVTHCRITRDGHYVKVEVPRPDPVAVRLFPVMRSLPGNLPEFAPILGLDEDGIPLLLRLTSPDIAHILISGTTGSGKTALARSMIASLALQNPPDRLKLLLIDPKSRGYRNFNGLPNLVCPVVTDPVDGLHRLRWAVRHMEKRDENDISSPVLVIFIDELADLMALNNREVETAINRLTQGGREAGIHLVACTQRPAPGVVGSVAKSNFPTRIVGRVVSPEDARLATGVASSGAEKLTGRGDFLLFTQGDVTRLQGAHISTAEIEQTIVHLGGVLDYSQPAHSERHAKQAANYPAPTQHNQPFKRQSPPAADDYGDEYEEQQQPAPPRRRAASGNKRQARAYRESANYGQEAMGIAERLEKFQQRIVEGRKQAPIEEDYSYYNPSRQQPKPTKSVPKNSKLDVWDEDDEFLEDEVADLKAQGGQKKTITPASNRTAKVANSSTGASANEAKLAAFDDDDPVTGDGGKRLMGTMRERFQANLQPLAKRNFKG